MGNGKKVKIEVLKEFMNNLPIGSITYTSKEAALNAEQEGYVRILRDEDEIKEIPKSLNYIENDIRRFIEYLGHSNYWFNVFKPTINGERPKGLLSNSFFKNNKKDIEALYNRIIEYNGKGIVCLAVNDRKDKDQTICSIDRLHSLVIDVDVKKSFKQGHVSLAEHHEKAISIAYDIKKYLEDKGFKVSIIVDSGNGAQLYLYIDEEFSKEYQDKRKELIKTISDTQKLEEGIKDLWKSQELYLRIESLEKDLKEHFNIDIVQIDNITKDINRRMKIAGTINKKDEQQIEDRVSRILYLKEDYKHDDRDNYLALISNYEPQLIKSIVNTVQAEVIVNVDDTKVLYKLNSILTSKKDKDKEFIKTFNGLNLNELYAGDRSSAEQYVVNSLYAKGFRDFKQMEICMNKCKLGKWQESQMQYRELTFKKAKEKIDLQVEDKNHKKSSFEAALSNYKIYLLRDRSSSSYLIHDKNIDSWYMKEGENNLSSQLYAELQQQKVDFNILNLYYPESNSRPKQLLNNYIEDNGLIEPIDNINFKPIDNLIFIEDNKKYFNTYRPTRYLSMSRIQDNINLVNDCPNILLLLNNVCGNKKDSLDYFIKLLAFMLQNPHIKTEKLIIFYGEEGSGKGLTFNLIIKSLFDKYAITLNQNDLESKFNKQMSQKIAIYFNEVQNNPAVENILKNWITEPYLTINEKNVNERQERSYFTIFADVNGNNPIQAGERRTVYFKSKTLGGSHKKSQELGLKFVECIPKEMDKFAQYLKNLEVTHSEIRKGCDNLAKSDVLDNALTVDKQFVNSFNDYTNINSWIESMNGSHDTEIGKYISGDWIEISFLLNCYNNFRHQKGLRSVILNKFSWIYDYLDIDRDNKEQVKRVPNIQGHKVYWIKLSLLKGKFEDDRIDKINYEEVTLK